MEESAFGGTVQLERQVIPAGEQIFAQGDGGDCAYVLLRGKVALFHHLEGHRTEVGDISPGEIFGEMAVLDGGNRSASAIAVEEAEIALVPYPIFRRKLDGADRFLRALIELFIRNIRNSSRLFLRRPRSFRDHVKQMRVFSWNMRRFAGRMDDAVMADDLLDVLDRLDTVLTDLQNVSDLCADKRHDLITEDELNGIGFGNVVGSEGQRKL